MLYTINVRYRTNSGCNAKLVIVDTDSVEKAFQIASDKVSNMRGVIRIDGGDWQHDWAAYPDNFTPKS